MSINVSPLAQPFPHIPPVSGVSIRVARAGYKDWDREDLTFVELQAGTKVAGLVTRNLCCSSEVDLCRHNIKLGHARALVVNAGNSNAFTGRVGRETVQAIVEKVATHLGCEHDQIFVCSTGVIGVPLPQDKARHGLDAAFQAGDASWEAAASAIGTTDTFPKGVTARIDIEGQPVQLSAIIKGSGMIAPDMATMLGFIFTDAAVDQPFLQQLLTEANAETFGAITVDSDTSTSDTVLAFATGAAGNPCLRPDSLGASAFATAFKNVCGQLARLVVRDGEGARKFIEVKVSGAVNDTSARRVGLAIANSPLVKTAIAGEDANWGRIVMAVGKAGEPADRDRLSIGFGGVWVARDGQPWADYDEVRIQSHLQGQEIDISVELGMGAGAATVWTCDLTNEYVSINAHYRS